MQVNTPPQRFVDESDGQPIEEIEPAGSRFGTIAVKRLDDGIEVRAIERGTEQVHEFHAQLTEQLYRGVSVDGIPRRDIDEDILDTLQLLGYTAVDDEIKTY